jgi:CheY-like chemotaxis protein
MDKVTSKFPGKKILVVEDNIVNQEVTQSILELMDITVDIAEDGNQALQLFDTKKYDLIFMDILMPGMDGYQVTKEMRQREESLVKRTPIVALTVNNSSDKSKCMKIGMDDFISKPFEACTLEELLKKYM